MNTHRHAHTHLWIHFTRRGIQKKTSEQIKRGPTIVIIKNMLITKAQRDSSTPTQTVKTKAIWRFAKLVGKVESPSLWTGAVILEYCLAMFAIHQYTQIHLADINDSECKVKPRLKETYWSSKLSKTNHLW